MAKDGRVQQENGKILANRVKSMTLSGTRCGALKSGIMKKVHGVYMIKSIR